MTRAAPPPANVATTAFLTALARASADPSDGFHDPYAARFAAECPAAIRRIAARTAGLSVVAARSALVDQLLMRAVASGGCDLCVNLGAGFDARPYRLAWPGPCGVVEVDTAAVFAIKERLLPAAGAPLPVERLVADVRHLDRLADRLRPLVADRRVVVVSEGLLPYLPVGFVGELAGLLHRWAAAWITDVLTEGSADVLTSACRAAGTDLRLHGLPDLSVVEAMGWRCVDARPLPTARRGPVSGGLVDCVLDLVAN